MIGPLLELTGYFVFLLCLILGIAPFHYIVAFLMVSIVFGLALSFIAVVLEEISRKRYPKFSDLLYLFLFAVLENFGYRQLNTYWRVRGLLTKILRRKEKGWGTMTRKGFKKG